MYTDYVRKSRLQSLTVQFILLILPITLPYALWKLTLVKKSLVNDKISHSFLVFPTDKYASQAVYQSNVTNNKNQLWKTVRLTIFKNAQFQSVLISFNLVHPFLLLHLLCRATYSIGVETISDSLSYACQHEKVSGTVWTQPLSSIIFFYWPSSFGTFINKNNISVFYFVGRTITTFRFHLDRVTASDKTLLRYMCTVRYLFESCQQRDWVPAY